jgi:hypothetical protein
VRRSFYVKIAICQLCVLLLPLTFNACGNFTVQNGALLSSQNGLGTSDPNGPSEPPIVQPGSGGDSDPVIQPPGNVKPATYTCSNPSARGVTANGLPRLTYTQLVNTLSDVFGSDMVSGNQSLATLPLDKTEETVTEFNSHFQKDQVSALLNLSLEIAEKVVGNGTALARIAPTCLRTLPAAVADSCVTQFVTDLGALIHRRPLTSAQASAYLAVYKSADLSSFTTAEKVQTVIARMIQAPEAQFLWEQSEGAITQNRAKVDAYTVANRLAFSLTDSMPDVDLRTAASKGQLATLDQVEAQADRLLKSARGKDKVKKMFRMWLRLGKIQTPTVNAATRAGVTSSDAARLAIRDASVTELFDYVSYTIFDKNGTFTDLMTSEIAFPKQADLAKLMGTAVSTGQPVGFPNGRGGLISRPAILMTGQDRESPIKRGVALRTRILCEPVPPPPPSLDGEIANVSGSFDHLAFSSREVAAKMTSTGSCVGCHSRLNTLGFALGYFGPLGEYRTSETTYNPSGQAVQTFKVETSVAGLDLVTDSDTAADHRNLADLISRSPKARGCFAAYAFKTTSLRNEVANDNCRLAEVETALSQNLPIKQALIKNIANEDIFWRGF